LVRLKLGKTRREIGEVLKARRALNEVSLEPQKRRLLELR
jgi:hypothetical protein